eukprot:752496-Pleurochrysis_carterae.AAC.3
MEREKARASKNKFRGVSAQDLSSGGAQSPGDADKSRGFSDDDFKFASERARAKQSANAANADNFGLGSIVSTFYSQATEYATAASKQLQSMQTLFPSSELDRKLTDATNNEPQMPSSTLLYELGRATHREDDYRIILSAIWQNVLRTNQVRDATRPIGSSAPTGALPAASRRHLSLPLTSELARNCSGLRPPIFCDNALFSMPTFASPQ